MTRWFRMYSSVVNDPKVQKLSAETFRGWVNILCLASERDGLIPSTDDLAFCLRISKKKSQSLLQNLDAAGLIDGDRPHNWDSRQYASDVSTERVKRHRERKRNVSETATETPPEQNRAETEQKQKQSRTPKPPSGPSAVFVSLWSRYPQRVGKKDAERHFRASVKSEADARAIDAALTHYLKHLDANTSKPAQNGSTWFNNWRDWEEWQPWMGRNGREKTAEEQRADLDAALRERGMH